MPNVFGIYIDSQIVVNIDAETNEVTGITVDGGKITGTHPFIDELNDDLTNAVYAAFSELQKIANNIITVDGSAVISVH